MLDDNKYELVHPTKQYIRTAITDGLNCGIITCDSSYIDVRNIPAAEIENIINDGKRGFLPFFVKMSFKFKDVIKRIPILRNYARKVRDDMVQRAISEKNNTQSALDLSGIMHLQGDAFVTALYQAALGRNPDTAGWDSYMRFHASGARNEALIYSICISQEFLNKGLTVVDIDRYRKAYKSFNRKRMLKRIPVINWLWWHITLPRRISGYMEEEYLRFSSLSKRIDQLDQVSTHYLQVEKGLAEQNLKIQKILDDNKNTEKLFETTNANIERMLNIHSISTEKLMESSSTITKSLEDSKKAMTQLNIDMEGRLARLITIGCEKSDGLAALIANSSIKSKTAFTSIPGGVTAVQTDEFILGVPSEEWRLAMYLNLNGHFEPGTERLFKRLLKEGMNVVDVGANLGIYTLYAAKAGCNVYCYEPTPSIYKLLLDNITVNGFAVTGRVHAYNLAVANDETKRLFSIEEGISGQSNNFFSTNVHSSIMVEVVSLDHHLKQIQSVDVIKIDVEGAEFLVLQGMQELIKRSPNMKLIMEYAPEHLRRAGVLPEEFIETLRMQGFEIALIDESNGNIRLIRDEELWNVVSVNLLLARRGIILSLIGS